MGTIKKLTDKYTFTEEDGEYILNLGKIKKGEDTTTELLFEGFDNLHLTGGCSCVSKTKITLDDNQVKYTLKYTLCERSIIKPLTDNTNRIKITIKGQCS